MDVIAAMSETDIPVVQGPTRQAFIPLLEAHREEILSVKRKTFKYGAVDRQQLDVYYPPVQNRSASGKHPVLVFIYGGGFASGERIFPPPLDLCYVNLGAFFAKRGIVTVIPDYRLVPEVKFPEPIEDIRDAITFIVKYSEQVETEDNIQADFSNIFVMGHSAGSIYTATMLLYPNLLSREIRTRIRSAILTGGAYRFSPEIPAAAAVPFLQLYGSWEQLLEKMPATLLERATSEALEPFPELLVMASEKEPPMIAPANLEFIAALNSKIGQDVPFSIMKGHNHISPHWALGSGQGEEWAEEVTQWIKTRSGSR
ncbi:uncharacterized protein FIBRA_00494 [Fibroporia radiculosa]|uniref:BD-FAE-like domain-containing protein n=1 Tax=Fibroporia radiculosa TaxID=599839 RepID=J4I7Z0_9APHY|nr:uncharacterized protein FIBRA_00494 [Fibroporia radiculosa]CCL98496.1 predicted protein [Fibroporia radiculosa]